MVTENETDVVTKGTDESGASEREKNFDYDSYWEMLIGRFCYPLLKRAMPEFYEKVDITKEPRHLNTKFTDLLNTGKRGIHKSPYYADVVLEIPMKDGAVEYVLFHVEVQGAGGGSHPERMNHYRCLIYGHYRKEPVALAIITDGHKTEARFYAHNHFGTESIYRYNNLILADLDDEELKTSDNPIDLALYAAKCALRAKTEELQKFKYLRVLLDLLGERGWSRDDKRDLLLFLERIMDLQDEELEKKYVEYRDKLSKEGKIVYIPLGERELAKEIERRGMERGIERGIEKMARNLLADGYSPESVAKSAGWPVERVQTLIN